MRFVKHLLLRLIAAGPIARSAADPAHRPFEAEPQVRFSRRSDVAWPRLPQPITGRDHDPHRGALAFVDAVQAALKSREPIMELPSHKAREGSDVGALMSSHSSANWAVCANQVIVSGVEPLAVGFGIPVQQRLLLFWLKITGLRIPMESLADQRQAKGHGLGGRG